MAGSSRLHTEKLTALTPDHLTLVPQLPTEQETAGAPPNTPRSQISFGDFYLKLVHQEEGKAN